MKGLFALIFLSFSFASPDIFDAARNGDLSAAKAMVAANPDTINTRNAQDYTPLVLACYYDKTEFIQYLVDNGVKFEVEQGKPTALQACCYKGFNEAVLILLKAGADPNIHDANGTTPLIYATQFKHTRIVKMLLEAGAKKEYEDPNGKSALDYAQLLSDEDLVAMLRP